MTLAQEPPFKPGTPFKSRLAYDLPTRNPDRAARAIEKLHANYQKMNPAEQRQVQELLQEAWRTLVFMAKDKRKFSAKERTNIYQIAHMYGALKSSLKVSKK